MTVEVAKNTLFSEYHQAQTQKQTLIIIKRKFVTRINPLSETSQGAIEYNSGSDSFNGAAQKQPLSTLSPADSPLWALSVFYSL